MKKIYTFLKVRALSLLVGSLVLISRTAMAQNPLCGPVVENFNNTGGSTAGFTGSFAYSNPSGTNGFLVRNQPVLTSQYTLASPVYQLPANALFVGFGFKLGGTERVQWVVVSVQFVSTITGQLETVQIDGFVPQYTPYECGLRNLEDIPGFPTGGLYRLIFEFSLRDGSGSGAEGTNITVDDFRTNGVRSLAPLPVDFISFDARNVNNQVLLTWKVANEENVSHYEVEKSNDGRSFSTIGKVAKAGRDTYTYTDATVINIAYYRIKNVDNDGKFKYSSIARLVNGKSEIVLKAFPLPVQSKLTLQHPTISGKGLVSISAADGRTVRTLVPANGSMQTNIDMNGLQNGMYFIRFDSGNGHVQTMKVVKQ